MKIFEKFSNDLGSFSFLFDPFFKMQIYEIASKIGFKFNKGIYMDLLKKDVKKEDMPKNDPEVKFISEIDDWDIGGQFKPKENQILINKYGILLEIFVRNPSICLTELKNEYKKELINTLAHEGGHWRTSKYFFWLYSEKIFMVILSLLLIIGIIGFLFGCALKFFFWVFTPLSAIIGFIPTLIIFGLMAFLVLGILYLISLLLSNYACLGIYHICSMERLARRFAKKIENDPRWQDVIIME